MKLQFALYYFMSMMLFLSACSKRDIPVTPSENDSIAIFLQIRFPLEMHASRGNGVKCEETNYYIEELDTSHTYRAILEIYEQHTNLTLAVRKEFILGPSLKDFNIDIILPRRNYQFALWCDCVNKNHPHDLFYDTSSGLTSIKRKQLTNKVCPTDILLKRCVSGNTSINLSSFNSHQVEPLKVLITPSQPVSQLFLIATDFAEYINKIKHGLNVHSSKHTDSLQTKVVYQGFTPCGINVLTGRLNDAQTGIILMSDAVELNSNEILLASDCVFCENKGTSYTLLLQIQERGKLIKEYSLDLSVKRANAYLIKSAFFSTNSHSGGLDVNTEFNGVIDIVLPD